ncbi:MAG: prephenate dehydratase [Desulfobacterales bacterium]
MSEKNDHKENTDIARRLSDIRARIDDTDRRILYYLNQRATLCKEVGKIKSAAKDAVFKPSREKEIQQRLVRENPGPLPEDHLLTIYREILSSSRRLQRPQEVVYLGPEGTFSYLAGVEYLGHSADFRPCKNLAEVFHAVSFKDAELGIIPLENSLQGSVGQSLDLFLKYPVYVQAEIFCKISHSLLSNETVLASVKTVYSHPQALEQCAGWLRTHLPASHLVPMESTAAAGKMVTDHPESAAIGHTKLGEMFGLNVLSRNIEDLPDNWTRFMIIGPMMQSGGNNEKTSLLFTLPDKSGALVGVLALLAQEHINMKKLESRPLRSEKWQYVFFADVECDLTQERFAPLRRELAEKCHTIRILGSYPSGPHLDGL